MPPALSRKPDLPLGAVLKGVWRLPAVLALVPLLLAYVALPLLAGRDSGLGVVAMAATPFVWLCSLVFGALAVVRARGDGEARAEVDVDARASAFGEPSHVAPREAGAVRGDRAGDERPREWSADVLARIEWKRFEDLCCAFYREKGIRALTTPLGPEGGVDIHLHQDAADPARTTAIVQCRAQPGPIDVQPVRALHELMAGEGVDKAFFMAPGGFTQQARAYAAGQRIVLLDGRLFLAMLRRLPHESSARLLAFATEGDWTVPTCPSCGVKLVARRSEAGMSWGCRLYPNCRYELPMTTGGLAFD